MFWFFAVLCVGLDCVTKNYRDDVIVVITLDDAATAFCTNQAAITPTPSNAVLVSKDAFKDFTFAETAGISLSDNVDDDF